MVADAAQVATRSPASRSKLANGSKAFAAADGRSAAARLLRDLEHEFAEPFGGLAALTPPERIRVQACSLLAARAEQMRSAMASGGAVTSDEDLIRVSNALARAVATLERLAAAKAKATAPGPDLHAYLAAARAEAAAP